MAERQLIAPDIYREWRASSLGEITEALEDRLLFELLGDVAGMKVLDVGCGDGALALALRRRGAEVVGVDPAGEMLLAARARFDREAVEVPLAAARGERLPFADASFDVVLAKTVLCFVVAGDDMFAEMGRVLRPGGRFVVGELGKWSWWAAQRRIRAWLGDALWRRGHFRTPGELRRLAAGAGLEVRTLRGAVYYPRFTWAARLMAPLDAWLGRNLTCGAAFLGLAARKR